MSGITLGALSSSLVLNVKNTVSASEDNDLFKRIAGAVIVPLLAIADIFWHLTAAAAYFVVAGIKDLTGKANSLAAWTMKDAEKHLNKARDFFAAGFSTEFVYGWAAKEKVFKDKGLLDLPRT